MFSFVQVSAINIGSNVAVSTINISKRIFISKARCHQSNGSFPDRPKTYKSWKPEAMEKALDAVTQGIGIHRAALD